MKKRIAIIIGMLLVLGLCGCSGQKEPTPFDNEFIIGIRVDSKDRINEAYMEWYIDGEEVGGTLLTDGKGYRDGDVIYFGMMSDNFASDANLDSFAFKVIMRNNKGGEFDSIVFEPFKAEYGKIYYYTLSGSYEDGFDLVKD